MTSINDGLSFSCEVKAILSEEDETKLFGDSFNEKINHWAKSGVEFVPVKEVLKIIDEVSAQEKITVAPGKYDFLRQEIDRIPKITFGFDKGRSGDL